MSRAWAISKPRAGPRREAENVVMFPATRAQAPTSRPTWVMVLASMMLLAGGYSLISGLLKLRDPGVVLTIVMSEDTTSSTSEEDMKLRRDLATLRAATVRPHRAAIRAEAGAEVALALFALYATAAVLSRDRHGRALSVALGGLVILYRLAALPVYLGVMRDFAGRGADLLAFALLQNAKEPQAVKAAELAQRLRSAMISEPIVVAVLGIAAALLLVGFFGGRRGRALYGLEAAPRAPKPAAPTAPRV
jgi:hypothetical protein